MLSGNLVIKFDDLVGVDDLVVATCKCCVKIISDDVVENENSGVMPPVFTSIELEVLHVTVETLPDKELGSNDV